MKLYVMQNGTLQMPKSALISDGTPFDLKNNDLLRDATTIPIWTCLIEHEDGLVLFDAGNSVYSPEPTPDDQTTLYCLKKLGISPDDIRYVVCSHLHVDHSGYLKYFKNAKIFVHEQEYQKVIVAGQLPSAYIKQDVDEWIAAGLNWSPVSGILTQTELLPGIDILALGPGHAFGMLALLVHLPKTGNVLLAADAIYCRENAGPPIKPPAIIQDEAAYRKSLTYLLQVAEKNHAQIWYGHDMSQFNTLVKYDQGCYE